MRRQINRFTRTTILLIAGIPLLMGCSTMKIEQFENSQPSLKVEEFFDGRVLGYGLVTDRFGNLRREFKVTIDGGWDGSEFWNGNADISHGSLNTMENSTVIGALSTIWYRFNEVVR